MSEYSLARKLFGLEESDSDDSERSVIYISSSEDESSDWETDCSTDTEQLVARIEREVTSSPMLIDRRPYNDRRRAYRRRTRSRS